MFSRHDKIFVINLHGNKNVQVLTLNFTLRFTGSVRDRVPLGDQGQRPVGVRQPPAPRDSFHAGTAQVQGLRGARCDQGKTNAGCLSVLECNRVCEHSRTLTMDRSLAKNGSHGFRPLYVVRKFGQKLFIPLFTFGTYISSAPSTISRFPSSWDSLPCGTPRGPRQDNHSTPSRTVAPEGRQPAAHTRVLCCLFRGRTC